MRFTSPVFLLLLPPLIFLLGYMFRRGPLRRGWKVSVILRGVSIMLVLLALAGMEVPAPSSGVNVLYLLDASDSTDLEARERGLEAIGIMSGEAGEKDLSAWGVFGRNLYLEKSFTANLETGFPESVVDGTVTNIEEALISALGIFPEGGEKRIILLTDGIETRGEALSATAMLRRAGVSVYPLVPVATRTEDVFVSSLEAPPTVRPGEPHRVTVHISSTVETTARILFSRDGEYIGEDRVNLAPGGNTRTYTSTCDQKGFHVYRVDVFPAIDAIPHNNTRRTAIRVDGDFAVLILREEGNENSSPLAKALEAQGLEVTVRRPAEVRLGRQFLSRYDVVVLDNLPAYKFSYETMEALERYVRMGGGFLMIGGPDSFGAGGYFSTPVETLLPVSMDVTSRLNLPPVSVVMLIDTSGSMGGETALGTTKLDLVKEAVLAAVDVLNPFYMVGLCAFDADTEWTVPMTEVGRREEIDNGVGTLKPGGGTRLYPALQEAFRVLADNDSAVRHIILLSDGQTDTAEFGQLARLVSGAGITISTVGVGEDADRNLLEQIALFGKGRAYYTDDPEKIPSIFVTESTIVSRNLIVEEPFIPALEGRSDMTRGLDPLSLPALDGFVLTYLKQHAELLMSAPENYPLLAAWQYGLGRSAAFTSDLSGRWSDNFLAWESFPVFAAQVLRRLTPPPGTSSVFGSTRVKDDTIEFTLDVLAEDESFVNFLNLGGYAVGPGGFEEELVPVQTAPGRYTGRFSSAGEGIYTLTFYGIDGEEVFPLTTLAAAVPYPEEFMPSDPDPLFLAALAEKTGGTMVDPFKGEKTGIYEPSGERPAGYTKLGELLILLAILACTVDLFFRYLIPRFGNRIGIPS